MVISEKVRTSIKSMIRVKQFVLHMESEDIFGSPRDGRKLFVMDDPKGDEKIANGEAVVTQSELEDKGASAFKNRLIEFINKEINLLEQGYIHKDLAE